MIIVSAHREGLTTEDNARRSAKLVEKLLDIVGFNGEVIPTEGCFNNTLELCYIIRMHKDCSFINAAASAARLYEAVDYFNQDSVGFIDLESNPPRMGVINCKTKQTTEFGVCMSKSEPPKEITNGWVKMLDNYFFPYGELTVLDDLSKFQVVNTSEFVEPLNMNFTGGESSLVLPECDADKPVVLTGDDIDDDLCQARLCIECPEHLTCLDDYKDDRDGLE